MKTDVTKIENKKFFETSDSKKKKNLQKLEEMAKFLDTWYLDIWSTKVELKGYF